jgi:hypothetical protein
VDCAPAAFLPGRNRSRPVTNIAGASKLGAQCAVEYACRKKPAQELILRLSVSDSGELKRFLQVKIAKGVAVESEIVFLRKIATA